jgi:hypothetical protein
VILTFPLCAVYVLFLLIFNVIETILLTNLRKHQLRILSLTGSNRTRANVPIPLPTLWMISKIDEVRILFKRSAHFLGFWVFLTDLVLSIQYLMFYSMLRGIIWWCVLFISVMFSLPGSTANQALLAIFLLCSTVILMLVSLGIILTLGVCVLVYGLDRLRDLIVMSFRVTIDPKEFSNSTVKRIRPSFGNFNGAIASWNVHTGILYTDDAANSIADFARACVEKFRSSRLSIQTAVR